MLWKTTTLLWYAVGGFNGKKVEEVELSGSAWREIDSGTGFQKENTKED